MTETLITEAPTTSPLFKDGTHKWGGTIYAVNVFDAEGKYLTRIHTGVVKKMNKHYIETYGKEQSYLVNDWTAPSFVNGERQNNVTYHTTRAQAMARMEAIRAAITEVAA